MRPKLVCVDETFVNGPSLHHWLLFSKYFDVSNYDPDVKYDGTHTFLYRTDDAHKKVAKHKDSKCIADALWECDFFCNTDFNEMTIGLVNNGHYSNHRIIRVPKWFWFEEHFSQHDKKTLVKDFPFEHRKSKLFLLQMGDAKPPRVALYERLQKEKLLDNALYSFLEFGTGLEGPVTEYDPVNPPFPQRNYMSKWYNDTCFTTICETNIVNDGIFITEKTMKPIMYGHHFLMLGDTGSLEVLKSWGFKTFSNVFDESYDSMTSLDDKIELVVTQIKNYNCEYTTETLDRIRFNYDRFWDRNLVEKLMVKELINPILSFITNRIDV